MTKFAAHLGDTHVEMPTPINRLNCETGGEFIAEQLLCHQRQPQ